VWSTLQGILRHLAVLKYMQSLQKHPLFGFTMFNIHNKQQTPLVLGVSARGLYVFRVGQLQHHAVAFSWSECSELSYLEKKFTIQVRMRIRIKSYCSSAADESCALHDLISFLARSDA
jgi:hypothetical protein